MADSFQATCKYNGGKVFDGEYGPYTDAVFEYEGNEIKVYGDEGSDLFKALYELEKGEDYTIIEKDGSYKLADSEIAQLLGQNGQQGPPPQQQPHPAGQQGVAQEPDPQELAKKHARLIANTYAYLDKQFADKGDKINQVPTPAEIQKMAVSAAIEAVR